MSFLKKIILCCFLGIVNVMSCVENYISHQLNNDEKNILYNDLVLVNKKHVNAVLNDVSCKIHGDCFFKWFNSLKAQQFMIYIILEFRRVEFDKSWGNAVPTWFVPEAEEDLKKLAIMLSQHVVEIQERFRMELLVNYKVIARDKLMFDMVFDMLARPPYGLNISDPVDKIFNMVVDEWYSKIIKNRSLKT